MNGLFGLIKSFAHICVPCQTLSKGRNMCTTHWKPRVVIMPTSPSLAAPAPPAFITTMTTKLASWQLRFSVLETSRPFSLSSGELDDGPTMSPYQLQPCIHNYTAAQRNQICKLIIIWTLWVGEDAAAGLILGLRPVNEGRRYFVTTSLIGWAQA